MKKPSGSIVIGVTAGWMHGDEQRRRFNGRPLLFLERSMGEWLMGRQGWLPMMIPGVSEAREGRWDPGAYMEVIDGLVVQGGVDVAPESYGERPLRSQWAGDRQRDRYEVALIEAALDRGVPVLGICRGHQILNVALGGSLYQDIATQVGRAVQHTRRELYERNTHRVALVEGSGLAARYGQLEGRVNSVHHQAIKELGQGLEVEARSPEDGIIEAVRWRGDGYALGIQWHPEFQAEDSQDLLDATVLLEEWEEAVRKGGGGGE